MPQKQKYVFVTRSFVAATTTATTTTSSYTINPHPSTLQTTKQVYLDQLANAIPRWKSLLSTCRTASIEVLFTVIQSLTKDGRDRGLDYKISGFHVTPGSWDAQVLEELQAPEGTVADEIILPKTSSSVFLSTNIDYVLRNLGIKQIIACGCVTDQCVEHAVRDACDLGYLVTLVSDGCVTWSEERQRASLAAVSGYCRQRTSAQVIDEIERLHV